DDLADGQVAGAEVELLDGERAEIAEEVHHRIGVAGGALVGQSLQLQLDRGDDVGGQQLAELAFTQQLPEQVPVERQRRRPSLGEGRVRLVEVGGDEGEQQRRGERRRRGDLHVDDAYRPGPDLAEDLGERRQVEVVLED